MTISGFTSESACMMIFGLGTLVRKWTWVPTDSSKRTSNIIPYIWADGSMATTFDVLSSIGSTFLAKKILEKRALYGIITPLENPEVPEV